MENLVAYKELHFYSFEPKLLRKNSEKRSSENAVATKTSKFRHTVISETLRKHGCLSGGCWVKKQKYTELLGECW